MPKFEYWDLYTRDRVLTGRKTRRDPDGHTDIPPGTYHLVVECVIVDKKKNMLFTQRAPGVKHHAGFWECTTGSVKAGEDSLTGIHREVLEETGLDIPLEKFKLLKTIITDIVIRDIYVVLLDRIELSKIKGLEGETSGATMLPLDTVAGFIRPIALAPDGTVMQFRGPQMSRLQHVFGLIQRLYEKKPARKRKRDEKKPAFEVCDNLDVDVMVSQPSIPTTHAPPFVEFEEVTD